MLKNPNVAIIVIDLDKSHVRYKELLRISESQDFDNKNIVIYTYSRTTENKNIIKSLGFIKDADTEYENIIEFQINDELKNQLIEVIKAI